jgi:hypothetical protein
LNERDLKRCFAVASIYPRIVYNSEVAHHWLLEFLPGKTIVDNYILSDEDIPLNFSNVQTLSFKVFHILTFSASLSKKQIEDG